MANSTDKRKLPNWLKMTVIAIVAFAGGLGGIYFGQIILGQTDIAESTPVFGPSNPISADQFITFYPGDLFPQVQYLNLNGQSGNFSDLIGENGSIIIFVSFSCSTCFEVLEFWQDNISASIAPGVRVIAAIHLQDESFDLPSEYVDFFKGMEIAWIDQEFWAETYGLTFWPTIVGVDGSGFVIHVQSGFSKYLNHELATYFLKTNQ